MIAGMFLAAGPNTYADESADPIGAKLETARLKYKKDLEQFSNSVKDLLDKKEESARKTGNKAVVDNLREELKTFEADAILPSIVPASFERKLSAIRGEMEQAFKLAIKDYTKKRSDDDAKKVEEELKVFRDAAVLSATKQALLGTWKLQIGSYSSDLVFHANETVEITTERATSPWKIDLKANIIDVEGVGKVKLPLSEKGTSGVSFKGDNFTMTKQR